MLVAVIGISSIVSAQDTPPKCGISWETKKFGLDGYDNGSFWGPTFCVVFSNTTANEVTISATVKVTHRDGDIKNFTETFTIKPYSTRTTTRNKWALFDTGWQFAPAKEEVYVTCK